MIKRSECPAKKGKTKQVKVTFALPVDEVDQAVSVVGDFNGWDPLAHPLRKRSNGTRSVSVELPVGTTARFKYLTHDGHWLCDPDADGEAANDHGGVDSILTC